MATISHAVSDTDITGWDLILWETMGNADEGEAWKLETGQPGDIVVQVVGTFGAATVKVQGSLDGTNWADLDDLSGTAIAITAGDLAGVRQGPLYIRPQTSGGTGTDLDVYLLVRYLK